MILFDGLGWLLGDSALAGSSNARVALIVLVVSWVLSGSYIGLVHRLMVPAGLLYQSAWWSMAFQAIVFLAIMLAAALRFDLLATSILAVSYTHLDVYKRQVLELVRAFEHASGRKIPCTITQRRPGDVAEIWADPARAMQVLGLSLIHI